MSHTTPKEAVSIGKMFGFFVLMILNLVFAIDAAIKANNGEL